MKAKILLAVGGALIGAGLSSCGGSGSNGCYGDNGNVAVGNPSAVEPQTLTVQQVLALAEQRSESSEPFAVDNGATAITPADDETSDPESI
jgi:hypothetical protein